MKLFKGNFFKLAGVMCHHRKWCVFSSKMVVVIKIILVVTEIDMIFSINYSYILNVISSSGKEIQVRKTNYFGWLDVHIFYCIAPHFHFNSKVWKHLVPNIFLIFIKVNSGNKMKSGSLFSSNIFLGRNQLYKQWW